MYRGREWRRQPYLVRRPYLALYSRIPLSHEQVTPRCAGWRRERWEAGSKAVALGAGCASGATVGLLAADEHHVGVQAVGGVVAGHKVGAAGIDDIQAAELIEGNLEEITKGEVAPWRD